MNSEQAAKVVNLIERLADLTAAYREATDFASIEEITAERAEVRNELYIALQEA